MKDLLSIVYEDCRQLILSTGRIEENISEIKNLKLKNKMLDMIKTVQADLMISIEFIYEVMQCDTETDLESLFDSYNQQNEVVN
jgi:hypothetical protein